MHHSPIVFPRQLKPPRTAELPLDLQTLIAAHKLLLLSGCATTQRFACNNLTACLFLTEIKTNYGIAHAIQTLNNPHASPQTKSTALNAIGQIASQFKLPADRDDDDIEIALTALLSDKEPNISDTKIPAGTLITLTHQIYQYETKAKNAQTSSTLNAIPTQPITHSNHKPASLRLIETPASQKAARKQQFKLAQKQPNFTWADLELKPKTKYKTLSSSTLQDSPWPRVENPATVITANNDGPILNFPHPSIPNNILNLDTLGGSPPKHRLNMY
ncbi:MAG: hypothetical protein KDD43_03770 [Bdellovibrionales bacterium]|nr:hypothetical protein [Bdellovibrionales bacterium]